jgi:PEP-CTERM motif-containing protein
VPNAHITVATGISDAGWIVGSYQEETRFDPARGFLRDPLGHFENIDFPDSTFTVPLGINNSGQIVGGFGRPFATGFAFVADPVGDLSPVPEPTTLLLFGTTAAGLGLARWKHGRRRQQP